MKPILVTGHSGFIGRHFTQALLDKGYSVVGVSQSTRIPEHPNLEQVQLDLLSRQSIDDFFESRQFDHLIHLAWYVGPKCHSANINVDWLNSSLYLLQKFACSGGKVFQGNGTVSEYNFSYGYLTENQTPLTNSSLHGRCKTALYDIAQHFCNQNGVIFKWARCFNLYGPFERPTRLMPSVIRACLNNEDVKVSHCQKYQDYLYVYDVAQALLKIFESDVSGAINVCSGKPIYLKDIVELIADLTHFQGNIQWGAIPASFDDPLIVGNNTNLTNLGWKQKISLIDGLTNTIQWIKKHYV